MKKKILVCMLTGAFALTLGTSNAYAARANNYVNKSSYRVERPNYVDNNNDGICDNIGTQSGCGRRNGHHGKRNR